VIRHGVQDGGVLGYVVGIHLGICPLAHLAAKLNTEDGLSWYAYITVVDP